MQNQIALSQYFMPNICFLAPAHTRSRTQKLHWQEQSIARREQGSCGYERHKKMINSYCNQATIPNSASSACADVNSLAQTATSPRNLSLWTRIFNYHTYGNRNGDGQYCSPRQQLAREAVHSPAHARLVRLWVLSRDPSRYWWGPALHIGHIGPKTPEETSFTLGNIRLSESSTKRVSRVASGSCSIMIFWYSLVIVNRKVTDHGNSWPGR